MSLLPEDPRLRAAIYGSLSFAFHFAPRDGDLALLRQAAGTAAEQGLEELAERLGRLAALAREESSPPVRQEFHDLFMVPAGKYVTPYGSIFLDQPVEAGGKVATRTCGLSTQAVARFYKQIGLAIDPGYTELPDYIGLELACMEFLCLQEASARDAGNEAGAARCRAWQHVFLRDHLGRWAKPLAELIRRKARTGYYKAIAEFLDDWIGQEACQPCSAT